jgi:hypothetical protein
MDDNEAQENELSLLKAMYQSNELIFGNPSTKLESDNEDNSGMIINQINNGLTKDGEIAFCLKVVSFSLDFLSKSEIFRSAPT